MQLNGRHKILIVDRQTAQIKSLIDMLKDLGFEVHLYQDIQKAYNFCQTTRPHIILIEWQLPMNSGKQLFEKLKSNVTTHNIPVVVLTREVELEDRINSLALGVDDYISKPFYPDEVAARIEMILHEMELIEESRRSLKHGFMGHLSEMNLVDLIQTLELGKKSAIIYLSRGGSEGRVYVNEGLVIDAYIERTDPSQALTKMLTWLDGSFWVSLQRVDRLRMINEDNHDILIKGTQLIHQWRQLISQLPSLNTLLQAIKTNESTSLTKAEYNFLDIFSDVKNILQGIEESGLDDIEALGYVKSLLDKGYLIEGSPESAKNNSANAGLFMGIEPGKSNGHNGYSRIASFFKRKTNGTSHTREESDGGKNVETMDELYPKRTHSPKALTSHKVYLSKAELLIIRQKLDPD
ncbi:MAG: response regulator [Actinobacteria bacterium]|nr:response regulator [Actinomycetota bacterium]